MRSLPVAVALILAALPPSAGAQTGERRFFTVSPGPPPAPVASAPPAPALTQRDAIRRWLCPNGGTPMRGRPGRCDGRGARPVPGGGGGVDAESEVARWHNDLPAATRRQMPCPPGTTPAEARANPGTVRCVPG